MDENAKDRERDIYVKREKVKEEEQKNKVKIENR